MQTLLAFLVAIILLVSLHELGHLIVAQLCGIKVLRFSVGIGKPILTKMWRNIEWCIAPFPLGGYVKMVDTREGKVAPEDLPYAFDKQPPLKRIAVVVAGPLTNLVLAIILYFFSFSIGGVSEIYPYIGEVSTPSIAAQSGFQAGDKILSVNGEAVDNFIDAQTQIILNLEAGKIAVDVETADGQNVTRTIDAKGTPEAQDIAKQRASFGLSPIKVNDQIGYVKPNSPAAKAGLQVGDQIIRINDTNTPHWTDWSQIVRNSAGKNLTITYKRGDIEKIAQLLPESVKLEEGVVGKIGVSGQIDETWQRKIVHNYTPSFIQSWQLAAQKTWNYSVTTLSFFGKLITGHASLSHISGPITIAEVAGKTVEIGWQPYIEFLALISISLGVMNLLPIPVLDGGHLLYYTIEFLRGKPLSKDWQDWGLRFGLAVMLAMMVLAFFNDITRLIG